MKRLISQIGCYIYTSHSIALISFTGQIEFIHWWTALALSLRSGTGKHLRRRKFPAIIRMLLYLDRYSLEFALLRNDLLFRFDLTVLDFLLNFMI